MSKTGNKFDELVKIVRRLRAPKGCPWDRVQTHETLKPYMVEEVYEALEAIDSKDNKKLAEELGDMLLHVLMQSEIGREKKEFTVEDVISSIAAKMIRRHPHVFSNKKVKSVEEVWQRWEEIKGKEVAQAGEKHKGILSSIPQSLPALYRADKVQRRAARVGFDWDNVANAWEKVYEEEEEIHSLLKGSNKPKKSKELRGEIGDLLFAVVNVARKLDIDAEEALQTATSKFTRRFKEIEVIAKKRGRNINKMGPDEMDALWNEVKKREKGPGRAKGKKSQKH